MTRLQHVQHTLVRFIQKGSPLFSHSSCSMFQDKTHCFCAYVSIHALCKSFYKTQTIMFIGNQYYTDVCITEYQYWTVYTGHWPAILWLSQLLYAPICFHWRCEFNWGSRLAQVSSLALPQWVPSSIPGPGTYVHLVSSLNLLPQVFLRTLWFSSCM